MVQNTEKNRYNDVELDEFKAIICKKIDDARSELKNYQQQLSQGSYNGTDDTSNNYLTVDDGSASFEKEYLSTQVGRQIKFLQNLEHALIRIQNKTYGICRVTGKIIPKERLMLVPHATLSIEAKMQQK